MAPNREGDLLVRQALMRGACGLVLSGSRETKVTTAEKSTVTATFLWPSIHAIIKPWYRAHNSAAVTEHIPMFRPKPTSHLPVSSRMSPPPVASPGFPRELPSVLSLTHPEGGKAQAMKHCCFGGLRLSTLRHSSHSLAFSMIYCTGLGGREKLVSKRVLFLHDHKAQAAWANIDNQVIASVGGVTLPPRFASIQSLRFRPKKCW